MRRLLIAGAGAAGRACIEQLSKLKHEFWMALVSGPGSPDVGVVAEDLKVLKDDAWIRKHGVEIHADVCVEAIDRYAKVVRGCDRSRITYDTLVLAAGSANPALARAAGLEVHSGVVVNDFLETSDAHVYALGEGTEHRGHIYSEPEIVQEQARVLAGHIAGAHRSPFRGGGLRNLGSALRTSSVRTCASLPDASSGSVRRSEGQTPDSEDRPALAGAV